MNGLEQEDRLAKWNAIYERDEIDRKPQKELTSPERLTKWNMIYSDAKEVIGPPEPTLFSEIGKRSGMGYIAGEPKGTGQTFAQRWEQAKADVDKTGMPGFGAFAPIIESKGLDIGKAFANLKQQVPEFIESIPSIAESILPLTPAGIGHVPPGAMPQRPEYGISGRIERPKQDMLKEYGKSAVGGLKTIGEFAAWLPKTAVAFAKDPVGFAEEHPLDLVFLLHVGAGIKSKMPKKVTGKQIKTYAEKIPEEILSQDAKVSIYELLPDDFKLDIRKERRIDFATREKVTQIQEGVLDPGALEMDKLTKRLQDVVKKETAANKKLQDKITRQTKMVSEVEEGLKKTTREPRELTAKEIEIAEFIRKSKPIVKEPVVPVEPRTKVTPTKGKGVGFDDMISFKGGFEKKLGLDRALEAYGGIVEPKKVYEAARDFSTEQLQGLSNWYKQRLKYKSNPAMVTVKTIIDDSIIPATKKAIPGKKALELKKKLGKEELIEKHAGFDPFGKKPKDVKQFDFWKKQAIADTIADAKKAKPKPEEVVFDSELPGAEAELATSTPLMVIKDKAIARVATGETNLSDWAKSQEVKGAERGVFKRLENGTTIVTVKEAKMLMDKNIPDIQMGAIEKATTPVVQVTKRHPILKTLHDMYHIKDRASAREYKALKETTIKPWKKRIAESGKNPKETFERIGIYLTGKQEGGATIIKHMKKKALKEADLTPAEKAIIKEGRAKFDNFFKRANSARARAGKKPLEYVEDYMSWMRNLKELEKLGFNLIEDSADFVNTNLKATPFKFAAERTPIEIPTKIELNFNKVFDTYAYNAMKHINMSPVVAKGRAFLEPFTLPTGKLTKGGKPEVIKWQLKNDKPSLHIYLNEWLNTVAGKELVSGTEFGKLAQRYASKLNKNLAVAILSANARSALIQFTAIRGAMVEVGLPGTVRGVVANMNPSMRNFATKHSKVLQSRNMDIHVANIIDKTARGKMENVRFAIGEAGLKPLQLLDMETARSAWLSHYKKNVKKVGHKKAVSFADDFVLRTQASGKLGDVAPIQRGHTGRLFTLFQTFTIGEWNWILRDVMGIKNPERNLGTNIVRGIRFVASTAIVNAIMEGAIGIPSPFPAPERRVMEGVKEGKPAKEITIEAGRELLEQVPVFGGAIKYSSDYRTQLPSPALQLSSDVMTMLSKLSKGKVKPTLYELETIGKILGIPGTSQTRKFISRIRQGMSIPKALIGVLPEKKKKFVY